VGLVDRRARVEIERTECRDDLGRGEPFDRSGRRAMVRADRAALEMLRRHRLFSGLRLINFRNSSIAASTPTETAALQGPRTCATRQSCVVFTFCGYDGST